MESAFGVLGLGLFGQILLCLILVSRLQVFPWTESAFWVMGFGHRLMFSALASGIMLSSCSFDGVGVWGFVNWLRGPFGEILLCLILAWRFDVLH